MIQFLSPLQRRSFGTKRRARYRIRTAGAVLALVMTTLALTVASTAAWASSWSITSSPNTGTGNNFLDWVSCVSATSCKAVGDAVVGGVQRTLIENWDAASPPWWNASSPNNGAGDNVLYGLSCASTSSCEAVGYYENASHVDKTLIESWNGSSWSIVTSPNNGTGDNILNAVSCVSAGSCKAVGYDVVSGVERTLTETLNGDTWALVSSPDNGTHDNYLYGVSCVSATRCQAVGTYHNPSGVYRTLAESWNGSSWSLLSSADNTARDNVLIAPSCVSASSCKAVGYYFTSRGRQTLTESWNGVSWSLVSSPNEGTSDNSLSGLSCTSATSCQAVGFYTNASHIELNLVESWDGTSWSIISSPNNGTRRNNLGAISCLTASSCKAVGYYVNASAVDRTLTESY